MKKTTGYSKKVMEHFKEPHNYGEMKNPDAVGKVGNIRCGDVFWLYLKVGKNKKGEETVKDVKFQTFGCVAAIATSSIITDIVKGKTLKEAINLKKDEIVDSLGGLPPVKVHCSILAVDGLSEAIYNYLSNNNKRIPKKLQKKHKRIQKQKRIIEEKYKDWVKAEEELHQQEKKE